MPVTTNQSIFADIGDYIVFIWDTIFNPEIAYAAGATFFSLKGRRMLKQLEGIRFFAYADGDGSPITHVNQKYKGFPTIGVGHLLQKEEVTEKLIKEGWTPSQVDQALELDLFRFEYNLRSHLRRELNQNQWDALIIYSFNIGINAFNKSTLLRMVNQGDFKGASRQFERWVYSGGKKLPGLVNRRLKEKALFLGEL